MRVHGMFGLVAGLASLYIHEAAAQSDPAPDLGTVLAAQQNLSHYHALIKKYPDVLLKLPSTQGVTIVAPSNAAFDNIVGTRLNGIWNESNPKVTVPLLEYHILQGIIRSSDLTSGPSLFKSTLLRDPAYTNVTGGQNVMITKQPGDVTVFTSAEGTRTTLVKTDIEFSGGVIQMVDNLLIPPTPLDKVADSFKLPSFLGGLYAAGLMPAAAYQPNVTIFAPRNQAFETVAGTLDDLDEAAVRRLMNYHIVPGRILSSAELVNGTTLSTNADGGSGATPPQIFVRRSGNNLYINAAQIVQPDILLANGVLHIVDNVLNPEAPGMAPNPDIGTQPPAFVSSTATALPFTTALPCTANCPTTTTGILSASTRTTRLSTGTSPGAGPRCTGMVAGVAMGVVGAGIAAMI